MSRNLGLKLFLLLKYNHLFKKRTSDDNYPESNNIRVFSRSAWDSAGRADESRRHILNQTEFVW